MYLDSTFAPCDATCPICGNDNLTDRNICPSCYARNERAVAERRFWERAERMAEPTCPACNGTGAVSVGDDNGADHAPVFTVQERCDCVRAAERAALDVAPGVLEDDELAWMRAA